MKFFFASSFTLSILCLFSCGNSVDESEGLPETISAEVVFGSKGQEFLKLNERAQELVRQWPAFEDVMKEVRELNGSSHAALRNKTEIMQRSTDSLAMHIPESFNTQIIRSRILVLKTHAELLFEKAHADVINAEELQNSLAEVNTALNNLLLQLNEKLDKDTIDIQRNADEESELRNQKRFQDSIFKLELQDKQNRNNN